MNKKERLALLAKEMRKHADMLERAIEKDHVPNTFATANVMLTWLKEIHGIALDNWIKWKKGE